MKNALKYLALWRKKRNEMHIDDDPQSDWSQLQSLLDQHIPQVNDNIGGGSPAIKALSLWVKLGVILLAAAVIYSAYYLWSTAAHSHPHSNKFYKENAVRQGANVSHPVPTTDSGTNSKNQSVIKQTLSAKADAINSNTQAVIKQLLPAQNNRAKNPVVKNIGINGSSTQVGNRVVAKAFNKGDLSPSNSLNQKATALHNQPNSASRVDLFDGRKKHNGSTGPLYDRGGRLVNTSDNYSGANYNVKLNASSTQTNSKSAGALNGRIKHGDGVLASSDKNRGLTNADDKYSATNYSVKQRGLKSHNGNKTAGAISDVNASDKTTGDIYNQRNADLVALNPGLGSIGKNIKIMQGPVINHNIIQGGISGKSQITANKKVKEANIKSSGLNWGILIGANSSGSFTPKSQNSNFYGSSPVDLFFGPFVTYNFNSKWAVNTQLRLLSPQTVITTYAHANGSRKVDSGQLLTITASRKMYSVGIPLYAVYKLTPNISFKLGPVINIPTRQINAGSTLQPYNIRTDTTYYKKIKAELDSTSYQQKLNYGLSGGVSIRVKRFIFEATYLKSLSGYQVSSGLGTFKSKPGTFQFTIGFQFK